MIKSVPGIANINFRCIQQGISGVSKRELVINIQEVVQGKWHGVPGLLRPVLWKD